MALNRGIISENYKVPLAFLHEQKRRIKVEIKREQGKGPKPLGGGGLGKPGRGLSKLGGPSSKFATTTVQRKPAGPSKLDERDE